MNKQNGSTQHTITCITCARGLVIICKKDYLKDENAD